MRALHADFTSQYTPLRRARTTDAHATMPRRQEIPMKMAISQMADISGRELLWASGFSIMIDDAPIDARRPRPRLVHLHETGHDDEDSELLIEMIFLDSKCICEGRKARQPPPELQRAKMMGAEATMHRAVLENGRGALAPD